MDNYAYLVVYNSGENFHHIAKAFVSEKKAKSFCRLTNEPLMGNSYWNAEIITVKLEK